MAHDVTYRPTPRHAEPSPARRRSVAVVLLLLVNLGVALYYGDPRARSKGPLPEPSLLASEAAPPLSFDPEPLRASPGLPWTYDPETGALTPGLVQKVSTVTLRSGQTVAQALGGAGLATGEVGAALASMQRLVDFRRLRPGQALRLRQDESGALFSLDVQKSPIDQVRATRARDGAWHAEQLAIAIETRPVRVQGTIKGSLWETMLAIGEDPRLAMDVAEVFSWDIDFYSDLHPGDTFRLLVEKHFADGKLVAYGPIEAAEFVTLGVPHRAFLHRGPATPGGASELAYYDVNGQSLRKQLLKSPLKYAHVTSSFGWRRHPVLGYSRAHDGIDYGVPPGTPVWAVSDGRVLRAGWFGGYGKMIEIRHANGYVSLYGHLSQILVRAGAHVTQKEVVGLSGSTGMSTGPHLHYGLTLTGTPVDPAKQKFERARPLSGAERERFLGDVQRLLLELQDQTVARVQTPAAPEG